MNLTNSLNYLYNIDEKFSTMAKNYYELIIYCQTLREDITVVFITHLENYGTELDPLYRIWTTGN